MEQFIKYCENAGIDNEYSEIYKDLINIGVIEITPAATPPPQNPPMMQYITFSTSYDFNGVRSIKPANIKLNIKQLILNTPSVADDVETFVNKPLISKVFALLHLFMVFVDTLTIEIKQEQAFVLVALWQNCNGNHQIDLNEGFEAATLLFEKHHKPKLTFGEYNEVIDSLVKIGCMQIIDGTALLKEQISRKYKHSV